MTLVEKMMMIEMKQKSESVYESSFVCQSAAAGGAGLTWVPQPREKTHFIITSDHDQFMMMAEIMMMTRQKWAAESVEC